MEWVMYDRRRQVACAIYFKGRLRQIRRQAPIVSRIVYHRYGEYTIYARSLAWPDPWI